MRENLGEKTEQPTPRRMEQAAKKGQHPRSKEVQTVFVLFSALMALFFVGGESWNQLLAVFANTLGQLHQLPLNLDGMQSYSLGAAMVMGKCVGPIAFAAVMGGLLAGSIQSRFQTASEVLTADWNRIDPIRGLKRVFSARSAVPALLALLKLGTVIGLSYGQVVSVLKDPIFYSAVSPARVGQFLYGTAMSVVLRVCGALVLISIMDYIWQFYQTNRDLMMTKEEVKEETKNTEGNPQVKSQQRRRRQRITQRRMLMDVRRSDVVVTNPTRLAIALRYDRKNMSAPKIVAKGSRLNAQRIREIAQQHQIPILENKPVAQVLFKYGRVGQEIPAQLYAAVAEILAWVYRINRYRYYTEQNQVVN